MKHLGAGLSLLVFGEDTQSTGSVDSAAVASTVVAPEVRAHGGNGGGGTGTEDQMGIVAELFVATDEEAKTYDGGAPPRFAGLQLRGLTSLDFETLWASLEGVEWGPDSPSLQVVRAEGEMWTFKFPGEYVRRLGELDVPRVAALAERWAASETLACLPEDAEPVIAALSSLARLVGEGERGLFLWGEL